MDTASTTAAPHPLLEAPVRGAMRDVVTALTPETSIAAAVQLFAERHVTGAPVVDAHGALLGVVTRTDLLATPEKRSNRAGSTQYYVMLHGEPQLSADVPDLAANAPPGVVADVMTRTLITVAPDAPMREAIETMVTHEIHRLLVVEGDRLLGVLSSMDVLRMLVPPAPPLATSGF